MKARILACAFVPALLLGASAAHGVSLSANGIGQALIYPFYTVDNGQDTLISVANASGTGKAVEVSFLEGYSGRHVLDLVLFLKAHDVWTASVSADSASGGAVLRTSDTSCTLPAIPAAGSALSSASYDGSLGYPNDGGPFDIARLREGMLDIIVGGDIVAGSPTDLATQHRVGSGAAAAPDCASLNPVSYYADLATPAGGIYGSGSIIDVGSGTYFAYNADALADFTRTALLTNRLTLPGLKDVNSGNASGEVESDLFDGTGRPIHLAHNYGPDALTAVFMTAAIYNDYIVDTSLGAATDWVIAFPTIPAYSEPRSFPMTFLALSEVRDREEGSAASCGDVCVVSQLLTHIVNVVAVSSGAYASGTPTGVFGSRLNDTVLIPFGGTGSIRLSFDFQVQQFDGASLDANRGLTMYDEDFNTVRLIGAPATGFMVYNIINAHAQPGMLANYGGAFAHHASFRCQGPAGTCPEPLPTP